LSQRRVPPQRRRETFLNKFVDPKTETAINAAPQVRGPSKTVFVKVAASKKFLQKVVDGAEDLNRMSLPLKQRARRKARDSRSREQLAQTQV
jgi:hypothetical protein